MTCFIPFNGNNLEISFSVFRPFGGLSEELIHVIKRLSSYSEGIGCSYSAVFNSIHGNLVIWYGAWRKSKDGHLKLLVNRLMGSVPDNLSSIAEVVHQGFYEVFCGESEGGFPAAKFGSGDIVAITVLFPTSNALENLSYGCLALTKSYFAKIEGLSASVCFHSCDVGAEVVVIGLNIWRSLYQYFSWLLNSENITTMNAFISELYSGVKYDVFRVVYVNGEDLRIGYPPNVGCVNGTAREEEDN